MGCARLQVGKGNRLQSFRFDTMGVTRTYWDFYFGFGLFISLFLVLQSVVLWQLAGFAKDDTTRARPLTVSFLLPSFGCALLGWIYILAVPALFSAVIAACLAFALVTAPRRRA